MFSNNQIIYGERIGFIGLGKLGMPCAEAIRKKGFFVAGYDIAYKSSAVSYTHLTLPTKA